MKIHNYWKIKKIYIRYNESTLYIKVPLKTKDSDIIKIINNNKESILKIVKKVDKKVRFSYENGSEIPFYGKNYHIIYSDDTFIRNDFMYLNRDNPLEAYNKLARSYGRIFYKERIEYFINKYNLPEHGIIININGNIKISAEKTAKWAKRNLATLR